VFSDPVQALQHVQSMPANAFDVVVADYRMPVMDGFELVRRLRSTHPVIPALIVSGYLEQSFDAQVGELGLIGVWLKTDNVEQLASRLEGELRRSGHLP
jgi:CheY-like chemotaxis protein